MSTVREHDFTAFADLQILVRDQGVIEDVHESDRITETNDQMEARRV